MLFLDQEKEHVVFLLFKLSSNLSYKVVMANSVELFLLKPYCEAVKISFLFRKFLILISINFSKSLEKIGQSKMSRKSPNVCGDETLGIGTTYATL